MQNKSLFRIFYSLVILLSVLSACNSKPKTVREPIASITFKSDGAKSLLNIGQEIELIVKVRPRGNEINKIEIYVNDSLIGSSSKLTTSLTLPKGIATIGSNRVKVITLTENELKGVSNKQLLLLPSRAPQKIPYKIIDQHPHNPTHFTQGLEFANGSLYESTGEYGSSAIYRKSTTDYSVIDSVSLDNSYFGEGITLFNNKIYQLTYKRQQGFIYSADSLSQISNFVYPNREGWGLTHNNNHIIMSDGTADLFFLDPTTQKEVKRITVCSNRGAVKQLNELEWINGYIYANIWISDIIVKIDPNTGEVVGYIDCKSILKQSTYPIASNVDVLNGIAFNSTTNSLFITGKLWPVMFELELL